MSAHACLRELHNLFAALVARPSPSSLIVGCDDHETVYLTHTLRQLDAESPADRFFLCEEPFTSQEEFVEHIIGRITAATGRAVASPPDPPARIKAAVEALLDGLPEGDHRLIIALVPITIDDPAALADLVNALLSEPLPLPLRVVIRDRRDDPHLFRKAEESTSKDLLAYNFRFPASLVVDAVRATAVDPASSQEERSQALLELAARDLAHRRFVEVANVCDAVLDPSPEASLAAFAYALQADAFDGAGEHHAALTAGSEALRLAQTCDALPIIFHAAMTLAEVSLKLGNVDDAVRCYTIAEHAVPFSEEAQNFARERRLALITAPPC